MHPPDPSRPQARPRPPLQRAPSSRLTALPSPLSPRRQRTAKAGGAGSVDRSSTASLASVAPSNLRSPAWSSSVPPDTPPLAQEDFADRPKREAGAEEIARLAGQDQREDAPGSTIVSSIPFPTKRDEAPSLEVSFDHEDHLVATRDAESRQPLSSTTTDEHRSPGAPLGAREPTLDETATSVFDPSMLGMLSRDELEKMLREADRVIRAKEEELSVFTAAGEGLLQEYHNLRNRHESLVARQRTVSGSSHASPLRPSRLSSVGLSPSRARVPSDTYPRHRTSRSSLGPPTDTIHSTVHHRRISSGRGSIVASSSYVFNPSPPGSTFLGNPATRTNLTPPQSIRIETTGSGSPNTSPTALRTHRFTSSSSVSSLFAPPPRTVLSPKSPGAGAVDPQEVESLSNLNYALTLRVEELEAESELVEKEGRKKLRKLEKELMALKEDLERSEGRNASLEQEKEHAGKGKARANRDSEPEPSESEGGGSDRGHPAPATETSVESRRTLSPVRLDDGADTPGTVSPSPSPSRFLTAAPTLSLRSPGNGVPRLRAVSSTSSLAPLPRVAVFDPSLLDAQQDELMNQLIAKIDELQDANEAILEEREDMETRLEIAREEVREWMGKCEELEEQHRIEWNGLPQQQIGWLDDDEASRPTRFAASSNSSSREGSPTPPSTLRLQFKQSLRNELSGLWSQDTPEPDQDSSAEEEDCPQTLDEDASRGAGSIVIHSTNASEASDPPTPTRDRPRPIRNRNRRTITPISFSLRRRAQTTADDIVPAGSLAGAIPNSKTYDELSTLADSLEPAWADEKPVEKLRLAGQGGPPQRLLEAPGSTLSPEEPHRGKFGRGKAERGRKKSKKNKALVLAGIRFGSDEEDSEDDMRSEALSTPGARRTSALRRLGLEASLRSTSRNFSRPGQPPTTYAPSTVLDEDGEQDVDDDDAASVVSSNYDLVDTRDRLSSTDYYPLTLRARYHPKMLANMMKDSAIRHVITLVTWVRLFVVLAMAVGFAVWQGPRKTLGLVDGHRRLR
ncbi:hypothetical protein JCM10212_006321 [Sporobolomyces blumeae]